MDANSSMFIVISLAANVATTSSSREPSMIVTSVVGPNSSPFNAATISDGRSVGDRSNVPNAIVPSRPAVMIAYWKAMRLLISPSANSCSPIDASVAPSRDRHGHPPMLVGGRLVGESSGRYH